MGETKDDVMRCRHTAEERVCARSGVGADNNRVCASTLFWLLLCVHLRSSKYPILYLLAKEQRDGFTFPQAQSDKSTGTKEDFKKNGLLRISTR